MSTKSKRMHIPNQMPMSGSMTMSMPPTKYKAKSSSIIRSDRTVIPDWNPEFETDLIYLYIKINKLS